MPSGGTGRWHREQAWRQSLATAEEELRLLEAEREALDSEMEKVRRLRDSLREMLGEQPAWERARQDRLVGPQPAEVVQLRPTPSRWSREYWSELGPSVAQGVVEVLREMGRPTRPKDVLLEMQRRGWVPPESPDPARTVTSTLHRLSVHRGSPIRRYAQGLYVHVDADV